MPAPVDHASRRLHVAAIAADIVAARGIDALTIRNVAETAGFSTAIVSHYFADKRDLLIATYRSACERSTGRFDAASRRTDSRLRNCAEALMPLDRARQADWRMFCAFWGLASTDSVLAGEQSAHSRSARTKLQRVIEAEGRAGLLRSGVAPAQAARRLSALIHGIGVQAVFDPTDWPPRRQHRVLQSELDGLYRPTE